MKALLLSLLFAFSVSAAVSPEYQPICAFGQDLCEAFEKTKTAVAKEEAAPVPRDGKRVLAVLDEFDALKEKYVAAIQAGWDPAKTSVPPAKTVGDPHFNRLFERVFGLGLAAVPKTMEELEKILALVEARMAALESGPADLPGLRN